MKVKSCLKKTGIQSERRKLKQKSSIPTRQRTSNSIRGVGKLKRTLLRRTRLSLQLYLLQGFNNNVY